MGVFLEDLPNHDAAMAYRKGVRCPLGKMASVHSDFKFSVRLDVADFFPSITPILVFAQLDKLNDNALVRPDPSDRSLLRNALFVNVGKRGLGLAIGAPSSPMVSNFIMRGADAALTDRAHSLRGSYSRYADDMYFSTDVPGNCREFAQGAETILSDEFSSGLSLNPEKTLYMSRGTRRVVAGIFITPDGSISIGRSRKRYIRKLVHEFRLGKGLSACEEIGHRNEIRIWRGRRPGARGPEPALGGSPAWPRSGQRAALAGTTGGSPGRFGGGWRARPEPRRLGGTGR